MTRRSNSGSSRSPPTPRAASSRWNQQSPAALEAARRNDAPALDRGVHPAHRPPGAPAEPLGEPERALLSFIAQGHTDESAAAQLHVSPRTARRMTASIMERLGARSRFEAGLKAARLGWL
ncbi:response regulator transcription factor [Streptomyces sp. NPDC008001]|uniref:response regulator transcription factor n=1 Tax=Streptomyces sp. NPDC008001 TaxID=3364804 RepID=UPI0036EC2F1F